MVHVFGIYSDINRRIAKSLPHAGAAYRFSCKPVDEQMNDYLKARGEFSAVSELAFEERMEKVKRNKI